MDHLTVEQLMEQMAHGGADANGKCLDFTFA